MFKHLTLKRISIIFFTILSLISIILIIDTIYFSKNVSEINQAWLSYKAQHAEKARLETSLRAKFGYGGMIHDFKNYILRKDFSGFVRLQKSMGATQSIVKQYSALSSSQAEKLALEDIKQTLDKYEVSIELIRDEIKNSKTSTEIDQLVKINDQFALRGLEVLRKEIISEYSFYNQAIQKPVIAAKIRSELGYGGMIHAFKNYVLRHDKKYLEKSSQSIDKLMSLIELYKQQDPTLGEKTSLDDISNTLLKYREKLTVVTNKIKQGEIAEKIDQEIRISDRLSLRGLDTLEQDIILQIENKSGNLSDKILQIKKTQQINAYLTVGIILILASVLFWIFRSNIISPVEKISYLMTELAKGNLDIDMPKYEIQTELGQMAKALHTFKENEHLKKIVEEELKVMAMNDSLTGLANRNQFQKSYQEMFNLAKRENQLMALLAIDLDKFKPINDEYGHAAGDAVLKNVAQNLILSVRETDLVARLGGDEFAVILYAPENIEMVELIAQRIIKFVSNQITFNDVAITVGTSIGISIQNTKDESRLDDVMHQADMALYSAKNEGRNTYRIYQERDNQNI
jgi:diguanylate cyclase (GGDEF)-like protein